MMIIGSPIVRRLARPSAATARAIAGAKSFSPALDRERLSALSCDFVIDDDPLSTRGRRHLLRDDWSRHLARTVPRGRASSSLGVGGKGMTDDDTNILRGEDCDFESERRDDASAEKPRYSLASTLVSAHAANPRILSIIRDTVSGNPSVILPSAHRRLLTPAVLTCENSSAERRSRIIDTRRRARLPTSRGHRAQGIALRGAREHVPLFRARGAGGGERGRARRVLAQVRVVGRVSRHRWRRESGLVGILLRHRGVDVSFRTARPRVYF